MGCPSSEGRDAVKSHSGKSKSMSSFSKSESKSSDFEIVKSKSTGLKSKSQKTGLESEFKSWFRVLHLCPTVQQKYDFMIATLVQISQVQCAL